MFHESNEFRPLKYPDLNDEYEQRQLRISNIIPKPQIWAGSVSDPIFNTVVMFTDKHLFKLVAKFVD